MTRVSYGQAKTAVRTEERGFGNERKQILPCFGPVDVRVPDEIVASIRIVTFVVSFDDGIP